MGRFSPEIFSMIEKELPPFFTIQEAVKHMHGMFAVNTLKWRKQNGLGAPMYPMGRRNFYKKDEFLAWLKTYLEEMNEFQSPAVHRKVYRNQEQAAGVGSTSEGAEGTGA